MLSYVIDPYFKKYLLRKKRIGIDHSQVYVDTEQLEKFYLNYRNRAKYGYEKAFFIYTGGLDISYPLYKRKTSFTMTELNKLDYIFCFKTESFIKRNDFIRTPEPVAGRPWLLRQ